MQIAPIQCKKSTNVMSGLNTIYLIKHAIKAKMVLSRFRRQPFLTVYNIIFQCPVGKVQSERHVLSRDCGTGDNAHCCICLNTFFNRGKS